MSNSILAVFRKQAEVCRSLASPFTASVLEGFADVIDRTTRTGARVLDWPSDPLADALPLRLAGGLHAVERAGKDPELSALYLAGEGDFATVLRRALHDWDHILYVWLDRPPQTNEVGRSGALIAGLMVAAERLKMPIELLEIGASAGLNLNLDRFHFTLGGREFGPEDARVRIAPEWNGALPNGSWPDVATRAGVDQNPLNPAEDAAAERLIAYCWPDQTDRLARLEAAIAIAQAVPVNVEAGDAADWIEQKLRVPQTANQARIVMHSVFWQYASADRQARIADAIQAAGALAAPERPLGWLRFEPDPPAVAPMQLRLSLWPSNEELHLAACHPHGTNIDWIA